MEALGFKTSVLLGRFIGAVLGFTLHEWAHAYSANRLGGWAALADRTRLTLDPRYHLDTLGMLLALLAGFGWARPVPVNPSAFYPNETRNMMIVAFAGPLTNLLIGIVLGVGLRLLDAVGVLTQIGITLGGERVVGAEGALLDFGYEIIATMVFFNILLFFFNLIPLYPLDGWRVMLGLLPPDRARKIARYERESMYLLFFLILLGLGGPIASPIFLVIGPLIDGLFELLTGFTYLV